MSAFKRRLAIALCLGTFVVGVLPSSARGAVTVGVGVGEVGNLPVTQAPTSCSGFYVAENDRGGAAGSGTAFLFGGTHGNAFYGAVGFRPLGCPSKLGAAGAAWGKSLTDVNTIQCGSTGLVTYTRVGPLVSITQPVSCYHRNFYNGKFENHTLRVVFMVSAGPPVKVGPALFVLL